MKALQTRSPIHLYYTYADLTRVNVSIYLDKDPNNFDTTTTPRYNLQSESINNESIFEISDLLRSANQYEFESNFYNKRDTAIYVLCKADLFNSNNNLIEVRHNFLRVRDGYVERQEQSQILSNPLPQDLENDWQNDATVGVNPLSNDPFGGDNAFAAQTTDSSVNVFLEQNIEVNKLSTLSIYVKSNNLLTIQLNNDTNTQLSYDFTNNTILNVGSNIISFNVFEINDFYKVSFTFFENITKININVTNQNSGFVLPFLFNPTLIKGNHINATATDLVLQDNLKSYSTSNITNQFLVDKKLSNAYTQQIDSTNIFDIKDFFDNNPEAQSNIRPHDNNFNVQLTDLNNQQTEADIQNIVLYECKYTPVKVTFLNRFGVLQDLVLFKKRVDSSSTDSESYKANVITNGEVYQHLGQRKVYNKQAEAKVKLSSGFYPESFNTVFKQLIFSEMVFIDDEPAVISTSTFRQKTQIDDKLINYDIDFDFANDDINSIR